MSPKHADNPVAVVDLIETLLGDEPDDEHTWLALTAVAAAFPMDEAVQRTRRQVELAPPGQRAAAILREGMVLLAERGDELAELEMVTDQRLIDVTFCARNDHHTGIQRTVRSTLPHWQRKNLPIRLASWSTFNKGYRDLTPSETSRVLNWGSVHPGKTEPPTKLLVPWRTTLILPEVMKSDQSLILATMAQRTSNRFALIGYDCIPVISAETLPGGAGDHFVQYLGLVKHSDLVAGISTSAAAEFEGFRYALPVQGLTGPRVTVCLLPSEFPASATAGTMRKTTPPTITSVGSHEPRKNHLALLGAAEQLWREGHQFRLRLIGGGVWDIGGFHEMLQILQSKGRDVIAEHALSDAEVWQAYRESRFTVFASLHEGYGLPVAESLALGVPVVATDYGSIAEIAADGGCLLVDPRDDADLTAAMRRLLTDDDLVAELTSQAQARPVRRWSDYADELWAQTEGLRA